MEYGYPELGYSQILPPQPQPPSVRSPAYDVYGQPRAQIPPLPPMYRQDEVRGSVCGGEGL